MTRATLRLIDELRALGFTTDEALKLRRISMTLHRWHELECGDGNNYASWCIERDEATGKPYMVTYPHTGEPRRHRINDREAGALKRLASILKAHPGLVHYQQNDPRGCALYILRDSDIPEGGRADQYYTRGIAICD